MKAFKKYICLLKSIAVFTAMALMIACGTGRSQSDKTVEGQDDTSEIMVFAAASLTDVLGEIIDAFEVEYHVTVRTNMGSSGTLARQIEQGEIPDVFLSASETWADYVDSLGMMLPGTKTVFARNQLALIAPLNSDAQVAGIDNSLDLMSLLGSGRLSIGDPAHVPAGKYAEESLNYYGWLKGLEGRTLQAKDVRSALMVVELEEAPLGIVYSTDAQKSEKVKILSIFPEESHTPVTYMGGVCGEGEMAGEFFAFLNSEETNPVWDKYGFSK